MVCEVRADFSSSAEFFCSVLLAKKSKQRGTPHKLNCLSLLCNHSALQSFASLALTRAQRTHRTPPHHTKMATKAAAAKRPIDVLVYGASGFTGRLVCEHLVRDYGKVSVECCGGRFFVSP